MTCVPGKSGELWTSGDHGEGNEVKGRRGSREWRKGGGRGRREEEGREDAVSALQVGMRRAGWRDAATHKNRTEIARNARKKINKNKNKGAGRPKRLETPQKGLRGKQQQ